MCHCSREPGLSGWSAVRALGPHDEAPPARAQDPQGLRVTHFLHPADSLATPGTHASEPAVRGAGSEQSHRPARLANSAVAFNAGQALFKCLTWTGSSEPHRHAARPTVCTPHLRDEETEALDGDRTCPGGGAAKGRAGVKPVSLASGSVRRRHLPRLHLHPGVGAETRGGRLRPGR